MTKHESAPDDRSLLEQRFKQFYGTKWYWMLVGGGTVAIFDLAMEALIWYFSQPTSGITPA
jgi:hypothetical protein